MEGGKRSCSLADSEGLSANQSSTWSRTAAQSITEQAQSQHQVEVICIRRRGLRDGGGALEVIHNQSAPPNFNTSPSPNPQRKRLRLGLADWVRAGPLFCPDWSKDSFRSLQHPIERRGTVQKLPEGIFREAVTESSPCGQRSTAGLFGQCVIGS